MDPTLRDALWRSLLQSDQEQRYWHRKACEYVAWDRRAKVFLACITSSAIAGWAIWETVPLLWKSLSVVASLLSIVLPILSLNDKVLAMTEVHAKWLQLMHEYDELWRDQGVFEESNLRQRLTDSKRIESELSSKVINLPGRDKTLGGATYKEVLNERTS